MYAYVLLGLVLAMMAVPLGQEQEALDTFLTLVATAALVVFVLAAGLALASYIEWRGADMDRDEAAFLRKVANLGRSYRLLVVTAYAVMVALLRWGSLAHKLAGSSQLVAADLAIVLIPWVVLLAVAWAALYRADRRLRKIVFERAGMGASARQWTLSGYLVFMARQYLLVAMVPMLALAGLYDLVGWLLGSPEQRGLGTALFLVAILAWMVLMGAWVRVCWRTEPLPDGALRQRLTDLAARAGVRIGNILVWRTNLSIANACLIGVLGPLRYIMITDAVLLSLSPAEIEAVFAHEVAHVKYRHVSFFLVAGLAAVSLALVVGELVSGVTQAFWTVNGAMGAVVVAYLWLAFGLVSRRCEQEADLYAVRSTACPAECSPPDVALVARRTRATDGPQVLPAGGLPPLGSAGPVSPGVPAFGAVGGQGAGPATPPPGAPSSLCEHRVMTFAQALRKIARLNGSPETARGWRHFSIAYRCQVLVDVLANPPLLARYERNLRRLKIAVLLGALAVMAMAGSLMYMTGQSLLGGPEPGTSNPSQPDGIEDPAGPRDVPAGENRQLVGLVGGDQVDLVALGTPELDRDADAAADLDDGGLSGLGLGPPVRDDDVAVEKARGHAVAVDAQGERSRRHRAEAGNVDELQDSLGGRCG